MLPTPTTLETGTRKSKLSCSTTGILDGRGIDSSLEAATLTTVGISRNETQKEAADKKQKG